MRNFKDVRFSDGGGAHLPHSIQTSAYFRNFLELYLHTLKTSLFKFGKFTDIKVLFSGFNEFSNWYMSGVAKTSQRVYCL